MCGPAGRTPSRAHLLTALVGTENAESVFCCVSSGTMLHVGNSTNTQQGNNTTTINRKLRTRYEHVLQTQQENSDRKHHTLSKA